MADYEIPDRVTERLRYFNTQFLQEQDFIDEQKYHINRQRLHNQLLHTPGIAGGGLDVTAEQNQNAISVGPGVAIDQQGRMIVLAEEQEIALAADHNGKTVLVLIAYPQPEQEAEPATAGGTGNTRWDETPTIELVPIGTGESPPPSEATHLRLASVTLKADGTIETSQHTGEIEVGGTKYTVRSPEAGADFGNVIAQINSEDGVIDQARIDSKIARQSDVNKIGTTLTAHTRRNDNPHGVTPEQIRALGVTGGNVSGKLNIETNFPGTTGRPGAVFIRNEAGEGSCGLVAKINTGTPTSTPHPESAAIAGVANVDGVHGVYAEAKAGTFSLKVKGKAHISEGIDPAHIVDVFINASGQRLKKGDVVKLKGTPVSHFRGENNTAPVVEVTLADQENDTRVIGIVDCEAIPDADTPDTRTNPEDPTFIDDGGELFLVTLGVYSHCKVDATDTPIEVGDLLTSSNNPGHGKKAVNPQLGSIIGKALEPLRQGTGYIAVFVNIQ
jgi:hypothetical protein